MARPPRIPVWLPADQPVIYFITICELNRHCAWDSSEFFCAFTAAVEKLETRGLWYVRSAVVMPDHLHALVSPLKSRDQSVSEFSGALKRWTRQAIANPHWDWQEGVFDRLLRQQDSAQEKWEYMRDNPVRAGLVVSWQAWPWFIGIREPRTKL
jgi:REP element-mobilizing transposase RayT